MNKAGLMSVEQVPGVNKAIQPVLSGSWACMNSPWLVNRAGVLPGVSKSSDDLTLNGTPVGWAGPTAARPEPVRQA